MTWEEVLHYLVAVVGLSHPVIAPGLWGYGKGLRFDEGVRFMWEPRGDDKRTTCAVEVNGEACEALGWEKLALLALPFRLTRVDLAFDGHELSPRRLAWAYERKLVRTKFRDPEWHSNRQGQTWTLGKKGGSAQVQAYNRRGFNRIELRLFQWRAQAFLEAGGFVGSMEDAHRLALGHLRKVIDFVDPQSDSNQSRRDLLPWWRVFLDGSEKASVRAPRRMPQTFAGKRAYLKRIRRCLGEVDGYFGAGTVAEIASDGRRLCGDREKVDSEWRRVERPSKARNVTSSAVGGRLQVAVGRAELGA